MKIRSYRLLGLVFTLLFIPLACNFPVLQDKSSQSSEDQQMVKASVVALAIDLDGKSPLIHLFVGHSADNSWFLPKGDFYLECVGEQDLVYTIGRITIPNPEGKVELGKLLVTADGISSPERKQELIRIANAVAGIRGGMLNFLYESSDGFTTQLFMPPYEWTPAAIQSIRDNYDTVLTAEDETIKAFMAVEMRAGDILGGKPCPGMCRQQMGLLDKVLSFFTAMNKVDQRAVDDVVKGSSAMSAEERADAFLYFPPSLTGGVRSFDEMIQKLQNGDLDQYAATRIRSFLMDEPTFVEALIDIRKTNRPLLQIAHEEGTILVEKGAEMQVEIVKQVLQTSFPGIEAGFNYADKVNEWAEFIRTMYVDPTKGAVQFATGQATNQIAEQINNGLLDMGYGEELAAEMSGYLSEQIVGQITKHDPELEILLADADSAESQDGNEEDKDTDENEESDIDVLTACIVDRNLYAWGYENVHRQDCTDPKRCTGCGGMFVFQNNSDQVVYFTYYYYDSYQIPVVEGWKTGRSPINPGDRWERNVSLRNEWKKGQTHYSEVVKIMVLKDGPECWDLSEGFMETHAISIERLPCE
jgi:hypothetical protein